jgi:hypothetical protein
MRRTHNMDEVSPDQTKGKVIVEMTKQGFEGEKRQKRARVWRLKTGEHDPFTPRASSVSARTGGSCRRCRAPCISLAGGQNSLAYG